MLSISKKQAMAAETGTYDVTGKLPAHELKQHLRAGRTCEFLNMRIVEQYGNLSFNTIESEIKWLKIS